jgi:FkbM family methyltransferase
MTKMIKCKLNGKFDIVLPEHRALRPEWYTDKGWEKKRLEHMNRHLGKSDTMFYIGVEEGDMTALCALWGAKLVMFEPNKLVMPNIKAIWEANNLNLDDTFYPCFASNVTDNFIDPITVRDIEGEVIHDHGFKELRDPHGIPQIKIDDIVERTGIIPTALSLDIEGSEGRALRGAEQTLRNHKPKIWLSLHPEFLREQYDEWGAELRAWIIDLGYKETLIDYPLHEVHIYYEAV